MSVGTHVPAASPGQSEMDAIVNSVAARLARGHSRAAVTRELVKQGLAEMDAASLVSDIATSIEEFRRSPEFRRLKAGRGFRHIWIGLVWFIVGVTVTLGAATHSGGHYVVAWGAMVLGAVESIIGLVTWAANR